jgi:FtsP/CotA-like multicopper oxidase with cupredoxin domain
MGAEHLTTGHVVSRRAMLGFLGTGAAAVTLASCGMGGSGSSSTRSSVDVGGTSGAPLANPTEFRSVNGLLEVALVASATMLPWGTGERYALGYNGSVPGPTLRLRPGDTLRVALKNDLDKTTNLHTHGLHVSPEGISDNIYLMVEPGQSANYEYRIPPDHPSGTFWYHPHHHGAVASQVFGGLAGAIVIEDAIDDIPEMRATTERVLLLSDPRIGTTSSVLDATTAEKQQGREGDVILVNGQLRPQVTATAGTVERWRIVNTSTSRYYRLSVDSADMHLIGLDQGRLPSPRKVTDVTLTPGQRAEVLVPLTTAGTVTLSTTEVERGKNMSMGGGMGGMGSGSTGGSIGPTTALLTIDVASAPAAPAVALPASVRPTMPTAGQATAKRSISFGAMSMGNGEFVIDGQPFSADRITAAPSLGTTEDWTITNNSMMDHPFHIHVWPFQVISRSDGTSPDPGWRDTVNIPTGTSVTIRIPFEDFGGKTVFHCHILDHEDLGMMANVNVT